MKLEILLLTLTALSEAGGSGVGSAAETVGGVGTELGLGAEEELLFLRVSTTLN